MCADHLAKAPEYTQSTPERQLLTSVLSLDPSMFQSETEMITEVREHFEGRKGDVGVQFEKDCTMLPNAAWIWANEFKPYKVYAESTCSPYRGDYLSEREGEEVGWQQETIGEMRDCSPADGLKRAGFVFWNVERVQLCMERFNDVEDQDLNLLDMDLEPTRRNTVEPSVFGYLTHISAMDRDTTSDI